MPKLTEYCYAVALSPGFVFTKLKLVKHQKHLDYDIITTSLYEQTAKLKPSPVTNVGVAINF